MHSVIVTICVLQCSILRVAAFSPAPADMCEDESRVATKATGASLLQVQKCLKAPVCLEPSQQCLQPSDLVWRDFGHSQTNWANDIKYPELAARSIFKLPSTGVKISLPPLTAESLTSLYARAYHGQNPLAGGPKHIRPTSQAEIILRQPSLLGKTGLTVVEMGCAAGHLLYNVRSLASLGGKLLCFEPDADFAQKLESTFLGAKSNTSGLTTEHRREFFNGDSLPPSSVDVFMSSHTVEHLADPCPWLAAVDKALKPGGLVFTEVPIEYGDPDKKDVHGMFHTMWFDPESFGNMMKQAGFEEIELGEFTYPEDTPPPIPGPAVRAVFWKP